ncbi:MULTISPECIES: phosphatase PAP2 family protein [Clostridium]|uniref:PAP2 superfamily protein n=2 Tax=Clostridium TaxID=1485 RepID=A0A151ANV4_9CLOT|nr:MULTISPECIES: phosphatase PAP2 family protein [Clostridium]KYH29306.1 PAP2 superfamily protein [Clostridium colicanis DSM 13634]PRR70980.1 PAP2 superfamily protein [Clostridium thermopalmarium DSM 5974]PVZ28902.1 PAP2 superfamily protein [Clostridium thermopalmarium DSM 5974]
MNYIRRFIKGNMHFLYLLLFVPLILVFCFCEKFITPKYIIHSKYDDYIPFIKFFIVPYMFWFVYMAIGFVYFGLKSRKDFIKLFKFIFFGMSVSYVIFILFPNWQNMRPILKDKDVFSVVVGFIYSVDSSTNVFPSIHVINSIGVNIAICESSLFIERKSIKILSSLVMILICASTVFIKQHSLIDVIGGIVLSAVLYVCIYYIPERHKAKYNGEVKLS